ncbi:lamin tail domain-containing protein [Paucibacter sp. PLA-PC-4]|uniref:lamin tail domain-containing protein n=1 Tax=Paucibacter sp. PLA-PC-4 TaxID=2993655 RepID=UPI0022488CC7|nr:lamin tail domain-containing protein [Paucibacter sp. PLA-PC-4]MCX2860842.1 lamin tail domain-containing protein [Paucibacter sp. PLA-PC-4]
MSKTISNTLIAATLGLGSLAAQAQVQITEWLYNTSEFIEFTNLGSSAVDFSGWSFDDDSRLAGVVNLSGFGLVGAGESVILAESDAADFRAAWGLTAGVKVIGNNGTNLGRADEINLFDGAGQLVDRLTYGDQARGTVRADTRSGNPLSLADLQQTTPTRWVLASDGDAFGSRLSLDGGIGNPGQFALAVPEPSSYALLIGGLALLAGVARRRAK